MDKATNDLSSRLRGAWFEQIDSGHLVSEVVTLDSNPLWKAGDRIRFGLRVRRDRVEYFAENLTDATSLQLPMATAHLGPYICELNAYRGLKPRAVDFAAPDANVACSFHCQDASHPLSLRTRTALLSVGVTHHRWQAFYNLAPIEPTGHIMWLPVDGAGSLPHVEQQLTEEFLNDAISLSAQFRQWILFFNSVSAGASVNHIHIQAIFRTRPLPIENAKSVDYKGWPVLGGHASSGWIFSSRSTAKLSQAAALLRRRAIPFNLIAVAGSVFLIPRSGDAVAAELGGITMAALEMAGKVIVTSPDVFAMLTEETVRSAQQRLCANVRQLCDELGHA